MLVIAGDQKRLESAIRAVVAEFGEQVLRDLQGIKSVADLSARVKQLRDQCEVLEVEKSRKEEEHGRKVREVEHKVGLERKRQAFEVESAKREATLAVREENLKEDRKRFEDAMAFHEKRFTQEVGYLKDLMTELMKRLPEMNITQDIGHGSRRAVR